MRTLIIAALIAASAFAQSNPATSGPLTVMVMTRHPAQESRFMPIIPADLTVDILQVFVSTMTSNTARFRITIVLKGGTILSQEMERSQSMMSLAQFRIPIGVGLAVPVCVEEIAPPVLVEVQ